MPGSNEDRSETLDGKTSSAQGRRHRIKTFGRSGALAILVTAVSIGLSACGGSAPNSPHVASLGGSANAGSTSTGSSTTAPQAGTATQSLVEWANCMRSHGDPNQADPTVDANGVIHLTWNPAVPGGYNGTNQGGQGNLGPGQYCRIYLSQAKTALQGGQSSPTASQTQLVQFAECMRANGLSDYPDPVNGNLSFNLGAGGDLNPSNPTFQRASKLCVQKTGVHVPGVGSLPPGTIELNGASPPGAESGAISESGSNG